MRLQHSLRMALLAGSAIALASPALAAEQSKGTAEAIKNVKPFDVITHTRALQSLPVVNRNGESLGQIYDVVISGQNQRVLYALLKMSDEGKDASAGGETSSETSETTSAESGSTTSQEGSQSGQQSAQGERLYPVPFGAFHMVDESKLGASKKQDEMSGSASGEPGSQQQASAGETDAGGQTASVESGSQASQDTGNDQAATGDPVLGNLTVDEVVGMPLVNQQGETIADVDTIVKASEGEPQAVVSVGGFLGIGEKIVGLPITDLQLAEDGSALVTSMSKEELESMRDVEYDESNEAEGDRTIASLMPAQQESSQQASTSEKSSQGSDTAQSSGSQSSTSDSGTAQATKSSSGQEEETSLKNMVLVLDVEKEQLGQAPSFQAGQFPESADRQWHESVIAFYKEIFEEMPEVYLPGDGAKSESAQGGGAQSGGANKDKSKN